MIDGLAQTGLLWLSPLVLIGGIIVGNMFQLRLHTVIKGLFRDKSDAIENLPMAVLHLDSHGVIANANAAAHRIFDNDDLLGCALSRLVHDTEMPMGDWLLRAVHLKQPSYLELKQKSRKQVAKTLQIQIANEQHDGHTRFALVACDVSMLKSLQVDHVQDQKMQSIGQLAGGVAHDFNNLLTAISGFCDLILLRHEKGDPDYDDLRQIQNNANRAASLVERLLAYSRKQNMRPEHLNMNDLLVDVIHMLNRLVGEKVVLQLNCEKDLPYVFIDGRQFDQVIVNLVINARDAMPDGGTIQVNAAYHYVETLEYHQGTHIKPGHYICVQVCDHGVGIDADKLSKIFHPFFTTKDQGKGTGLGLSMVYGTIRQIGGYIFVESCVQKGSRFSVYVPAVMNMPESEEQAGQKKIVQNEPAKGLRVLLVEDEESVRNVTARALKSQDITLFMANCGEEALAFFDNADFAVDVVISDVVMPGLDGPSWIKTVQDKGHKFKVIFISGYAREEFASNIKTMKDIQFLPKPYALSELIDVVKSCG